MSQPLVTSKQISDFLKDAYCEIKPKIPVIIDYPSEDARVSYGVYIDGINVVSRTVQQESMTFCGRVYEVTDQFRVLFVSIQNDKKAPQVEDAIHSLVNQLFFDGYQEITYEVDESFGSRGNLKEYTFTLTRLDTSQL